MARAAAETRFKKLPEVATPGALVKRVGGDALRAAVLTSAAFGFAHAGVDILHASHLSNVWVLGGGADFLADKWNTLVANNVSDGVAGLISSHVPALHVGAVNLGPLHTGAMSVDAHTLPDAIAKNSVFHDHLGKYVTANDMVVAEGVAAGFGGYTALRKGAGLVKSVVAPEYVSPSAAYQPQAEAIVTALQKSNPRKYANLDVNHVNVAVQGVATDLRKADISGEAVFTNLAMKITGGRFERWAQGIAGEKRQIKAAEATLRKEEYQRLRGGAQHAIVNFGETKLGKGLKLIPGFGNFIDGAANLSEMTLGRLIPKRDVFGKTHSPSDAANMEMSAFLLGTMLPVAEFTSTDVKEIVELTGRRVLKETGKAAVAPQYAALAEQVKHSAAIIAGDEVRHNPRRYGSKKKRA